LTRMYRRTDDSSVLRLDVVLGEGGPPVGAEGQRIKEPLITARSHMCTRLNVGVLHEFHTGVLRELAHTDSVECGLRSQIGSVG
jgi:hypothetical protein